jgi:hypothetical protein
MPTISVVNACYQEQYTKGSKSVERAARQQFRTMQS